MPIQSHWNTVKHFSLALGATATHKTVEALFAKSKCLRVVIDIHFYLVLWNTFLLLRLASTLSINILSLELS